MDAVLRSNVTVCAIHFTPETTACTSVISSPFGLLRAPLGGGELNRISHIAKQTLAFYRVETEHRSPAIVFGFTGELRQILVNLIINALESGASRIRIRTSRGRNWKHRGRRSVRILIVDNGAGIPHDVAAKIFEPFFTTKGEKGSGLGLWVSQGIVQKHEGSISMRTSTRAGRSGTAFSIFLPAA